MDAVHEEKLNGLTIKIYQEDCDDHNDPRQWDNMGHMICFHRSYQLGDKHNMSVEELKELVRRNDVVALPLFLYDHSGITMSTSNSSYPFNCRWDGCQVGYIYITKEAIRKEYGTAGKKNIEKAIKYLCGEVRVYDDYIRGNIYGFVVEDEEGQQIDSCWGYIGDYDKDVLLDARSMVESLTHNGTTDSVGQVLIPIAV
jgi:hypothetical protein